MPVVSSKALVAAAVRWTDAYWQLVANSVMCACSFSTVLMAAASLARSSPNPSVELLPSQFEQVPGSVLMASTFASHSVFQSSSLCECRHLYIS